MPNLPKRLEVLLHWCSAFAVWLSRPIQAWLFIAVLAVAALTIQQSSYSEASFRFAGFVLQLLGILVVIYGIQQTLAFFDQPSLFQAVRKWIQDFPRTRSVFADANIRLGGISVQGMAATTHVSAGPDASLEQRVSVLEEGLRKVRSDVTANEQAIANEARNREVAVQAERQQREEALGKVNSTVEKALTKDITTALFGSLLLLIGVTLATLSQELSCWFS